VTDAGIDGLLRLTPIFRALHPDDRAALARIATVRLYQRGEHVFEEGDMPTTLPVVVRGRIKVFRCVESGRDVILLIVEPGDLLGAVAVFREIPFPACAEAMEDTVIVEIPLGALDELLRSSPTLLRGLLAGLTHRLVELTGRVALLSGTRVEPRFARLFLKLADETGTGEGGEARIPMRLSRQELADLTGTTIETAIRIMSRWSKEGVLETEPDGFRLLDRSTLEEIARG